MIKSYLKQYGFDIDKAPDTVNRILCIAPHPDDCEVGVGGLLAKAADRSAETYMLVLTDGSMGTSKPEITRGQLAVKRRKEQEEAAKVLGVKKVYWLDYQDG
ncbi:MAG: PIG-L family deacetylase, partial [Crenarchaeota archaeon]|nr:PIG-L family deacetylase [Thermoproteota archaeon]